MSMDAMTAQRHAEVAGAGFAGLSVATALAEAGWTVRVHEKGTELREEGAGILMWENSFRALEAIGAYDAVAARSLPNPSYDTWLDGDYVSRERPADFRLRSLTRQDLYTAILEQAERAGVEILAGSEVVGATRSGTIILGSGEEASAEIVVGADGIGSKVRSSLDIRPDGRPLGDGMIRMLVPRHKDQLGPGEWDDVIDFWRFEPRFLRVLYVPCNERDLYLAFGADRDESGSSPLDPFDLQTWLDAFPVLAPVLTAASSTSGFYHPYQTVVTDSWVNGRTVLVGDSVHAMCPALAQGAGQAICNGVSLGLALSTSTDIDETLAAWSRRAMPVTQRCQVVSEQIQKQRALSQGNIVIDAVSEFARFDCTAGYR